MRFLRVAMVIAVLGGLSQSARADFISSITGSGVSGVTGIAGTKDANGGAAFANVGAIPATNLISFNLNITSFAAHAVTFNTTYTGSTFNGPGGINSWPHLGLFGPPLEYRFNVAVTNNWPSTGPIRAISTVGSTFITGTTVTPTGGSTPSAKQGFNAPLSWVVGTLWIPTAATQVITFGLRIPGTTNPTSSFTMQFTATPEPASMVLVGMLIAPAGLAVYRRRLAAKSKKAAVA